MPAHPAILISVACTAALAGAVAVHCMSQPAAHPVLAAVRPYVAPALIIPHDDPPPQAPKQADDGGPDYPRLAVPETIQQAPAPAQDDSAAAAARAMSLQRGIDMMQRELQEAQDKERAAAQDAAADQARLDDLNAWYNWQQTHGRPLTTYQYHQYLDNAEGIATDIRNDRQAIADARSHEGSLVERMAKAQQELAQESDGDRP